MSPSTTTESPERPGDPLFGLVAGLYLALLSTAPVLFAVGRLGVDSAAALYGTVLGTVVVATAAGWQVVTSRPWLAIRLGATPARWCLAVLGLGYAIGGFLALGVAGTVAVVAMFFGLGAMAVGGIIGVMARTRHAADVLDGAERYCEFRAGWPGSARKRLGLVTIPLLVVGAVGFASIYLGPDSWLWTGAQLLLPVGVSVFVQSEPHDYVLSEAGVERGNEIARRAFRWEAFSGYTRTDDALVLHRPRRLDFRLALDDLDDPGAVEDAIAAHLGHH